MSKQVMARVDDDIKIFADALMLVCGDSQQGILAQAYTDYVFDRVGTVPGTLDLLPAVYSCVLERQKAGIAPLTEKMEKYQAQKAAEEAEQQELMEQYQAIHATAGGKRLLNALVRALQRSDSRLAVTDVFEYDPKLFREVFTINSDDDENDLVTTAMIMARIHTTQV